MADPVSPIDQHRLLNRMQAFDIDASAGARRYKAARPADNEWLAPDGDADTDTLLDLPELRRRSSDAVRNNPLALSAITAKATNVVGTGLRLNASIDREQL